jgi:glucose-1-phosphate thymidylyltransferase
MRAPVVGLLPAGGRGTRLRPFQYPKELLPVVYESVGSSGDALRPRAVSELSIMAFAQANIARCLIVVAPWKYSLVDYFGSGNQFGVDVAYLYQEHAGGLPGAVDLAYEWTRNSTVAFAMPDTIVEPSDCFSRLQALHYACGADLTLGVFPTADAARLGPVLIDDGRVLRVVDKCPVPPAMNTWGVAVWEPSFGELLRAALRDSTERTGEPVMGDMFNAAIDGGLKVVAEYFVDGSFIDVGTPEGLRRCFAPAVPVAIRSGVRR